MSFIAKNPLSIPEIKKTPSTPPGTRGLFAKDDGWYEITSDGKEERLATEADKAEIISDVVETIDTKIIYNTTDSQIVFAMLDMDNAELRCKMALTDLSITFADGEYSDGYLSGLSFNSGDVPTHLSYAGSGIINWVGVDCTTSEGLSIFQPSANTHYDIVFYYNGTQMIGSVNGFKPASGN